RGGRGARGAGRGGRARAGAARRGGAPVKDLAILLVEDNPIHARLARAAVETAERSWRLTCATTLGAACAIPTPPDVVLLDLTLPDSRGLETLARVRERFGGTPVVLLTASDDLDRGAGTRGRRPGLS